MLRALVWKEYREQRPIAAAGMAVSVVLPLLVVSMVAAAAGQAEPVDIADVIRFVVAVLVWPLFAAAAGATAGGGEESVASRGFLLSRPVSRGWVWLAKTAAAAAAVAAVVATSLAVCWIFDRLLVGSELSSSLSAGPLPGTAAFAQAIMGAVVLLAFACSVYFAGFFERALAAAGAGLATALVLTLAINAFWEQLGPFGRTMDVWIIGVEAALTGAAVLAVSFWAFAKGELLQRRAVRRRLLKGALVAALVLATGTLALAYEETRLEPSYALLSVGRWDGGMSPTGEAVAVRAERANGRAHEVWLIDRDGDLTRLARPLAGFRCFSQDGQWVFYASRRGFLGLPTRNSQMRMVRIDGSGDRAIDSIDAWYGRWAKLSPDGTLLAAYEYAGPSYTRYTRRSRQRVNVILSLDTGEVQRIDPDRIEPTYYFSWRSDGSELILENDLSLHAYNPSTREVRTIATIEPRDEYSGWYSLPESVDSPVTLLRYDTVMDPEGAREATIFSVDIIDLDSGEISTIVERRIDDQAAEDEHYCGVDQVAEDRRHLFYSTCIPYPHYRHETWKTRLHVIDMVTGEERALAEVEGYLTGVYLSPAEDRMLVSYRRPLVDPEQDIRPPAIWPWRWVTEIIDFDDGGRRELEEGCFHVGWIDAESAWVACREVDRVWERGHTRTLVSSPTSRLGILDAATGAIEMVYP